jgi:hypothetical protein
MQLNTIKTAIIDDFRNKKAAKWEKVFTYIPISGLVS